MSKSSYVRGPMRTLRRGAWLALGVSCALLAVAPLAPPASAAESQGPEIQEHTLSNGMKLVLVPRHLSPTVAGGWVARVGSANERPGITGISHLFEHMMFKGTHVIGTKDIKKDLALIQQQEELRDQMRAEISKLREMKRRGEIDDITSPEAKTERYKELEAKFDELIAEQRENMVKNEFNNMLQSNGATFINAFTNHDMTVYFETVPANKLELWFWLESDRLKNRVFREFYSERDVVFEERRMRTESTPTGKFMETFNSMFWDSSPYAWPVVGWPSDIANVTLEQANAYYEGFYAPKNLTAVLVGDFDPKETLEMAEKYLGSVPAGTTPVPEMITDEVEPLAPKRMTAEGEMNPGLKIRWHTAPFVHEDTPALEVIAQLLNGPTGRLQRNVILEQDVATSANANDSPRKYSGFFEIDAETKEGRTTAELEAAILAEITRLQKEPVGEEELQSVKNRYLAASYRTLTNNFQIMLRYLVAEGLGDLKGFNAIEQEVQNVTPADVMAAANAYLVPERSTTAIWKRAADAEEEDPVIAALPPQAKTMVKQALTRIETADAEQLQQMLAQMAQMEAQVPPEMKPAIDYIKGKAEARIASLNGSADGK